MDYQLAETLTLLGFFFQVSLNISFFLIKATHRNVVTEIDKLQRKALGRISSMVFRKT